LIYVGDATDTLLISAKKLNYFHFKILLYLLIYFAYPLFRVYIKLTLSIKVASCQLISASSSFWCNSSCFIANFYMMITLWKCLMSRTLT